MNIQQFKLSKESYRKIVEKAWADPAFEKKLLKDARSALAELNILVPKDINLKVVKNTEKERHMVLPAKPGREELIGQTLDKISAGDWGDPDAPDPM